MKKTMVFLLMISMMLFIACDSDSGTKKGDQAYNFRVEDYDGVSRELSDFEGKTVFVLAWTTT